MQIKLKKKKINWMNQGSDFLRASFSNRDNARGPTQSGRVSQPKNRPIHFHINNTNVIRLVKQNQLSFSSTEINMPLPAQIYSVL